jgi:hypothetical protein
MRQMFHHAGLHLGARLASVGLSFLLFAWIGRVLPGPDAAQAYFFSFALGFGLATARMCLQLGAAVDGQARLAQRWREAARGLRIQRRLLPYLALAISVIAWLHTRDIPLVATTFIVVMLAAPDVDLLRGVIGRASLFSLMFALGSLLALVILQWWLPHTLQGVAWALLVQWLPVSLVNAPAIKRIFGHPRVTPPSLGLVAGTLALSGFDGLVLNAPFLGWLHLTAANSLDLALVMRVFLASLPMLPLLLHWTNSSAFGQVCERWNLRQGTGFMLGLVVSGLVAGGMFLTIYLIVARQPVGGHVVLLYLLLLFAYGLYAPQLRFACMRLSALQRLYIFAAAVSMYVVVLGILASLGHVKPWNIVLLQALTLCGTGLMLAQTASSSSNIS